MPAKDRYHDAVVRALVKDGWTIAAERMYIRLAGRRLWIDIRAVKASAQLAIVVEVKGFENMPSPVDYLADVVGKYVLYLSALDAVDISAPLYLAVPSAAYQGFLSEGIAQRTMRRVDVKLIVFDPTEEEITQWIPQV
jgi:hypothetical protein